MTRRHRSLFSYYGSKSKVIHLYSRPRHKTIVEPFAGSGAYSLYWSRGRRVILNDLNKPTYKIWKFLQKHSTAELLDLLPDRLDKGTDIRDLARFGTGLFYFLRCWGAQGIGGIDGDNTVGHKIVTEFGSVCSSRIKQSIKTLHTPVPSWTILCKDYSELKNQEATWFVDPPYNNEAGRRYHDNQIDYDHLAHWCKSRKGFVIVCENEGADWLPFRPLVKARPRASYEQKINKSIEVIWTNRKVGLLW